MKRLNNIRFWDFLSNYFFLFLLLAGIAFNYYFQQKVNREIRHFTTDQELLYRQLGDISETAELLGKLTSVESRIYESVLSRRFLQVTSIEVDLNQVRNELFLLTSRLGGLITQEEIDQFKFLVYEKIQFYKHVVDVFQHNGRNAALELLTRDVSPEKAMALESLVSAIQTRSRTKLETQTIRLQQQKIDLISLDYAVLQLTSFIFLVIAGFTLYKILQVFSLNRNLSVAVQKEKEAQQVKDQFLSNMTHELRTPLNSVLGYTRLLMKSPPKKEQERFIRAIKNAGEVLLNVINEVLDYSKLQSGYIRFSNEPFNIRDQIHNLADIVGDRIRDKGLNFHLNIDEKVPDQLTGDSGKLIQILLNVTGNAVKFTNKGSITISVNCEELDPEKVLLEFEVADTGVGIPKEKLPHIFERFYQVDGGTTRSYSGTGLGLAITQQLVEMQGGQIKVQSKEGSGTRFFIRIPFKISRVPLHGKESSGLSKQDGGENSLKGIRVLVVDDNAMNRDLAGFVLKDLGCLADLARSGTEAIECLRENTYELVLMDVQMPGMDGRETTKKIRNELKLDIPVIALTAFSQPVERQRCFEAGMNGYISKPIDEEELRKEFVKLGKKASSVVTHTLDINYLKRIANGNQEFINEVILKIADNLPQEMLRLSRAAEVKDKESVNGIAHDLKTTFAVLGLTDKTKKLIAYLEDWKPPVRSGNSKLQKVLSELREICNQATSEITQAFSGQQPAA